MSFAYSLDGLDHVSNLLVSHVRDEQDADSLHRGAAEIPAAAVAAVAACRGTRCTAVLERVLRLLARRGGAADASPKANDGATRRIPLTSMKRALQA